MRFNNTGRSELNWGNTLDDYDYYGIPNTAPPAASPELLSMPIMDRDTFFQPPIRGPRPGNHPTRDIPYYDELVAGGIRFPRQAVCELPPWYAVHDALPRGFECAQASSEEDYKRIKTSWTVCSPKADAIMAALEVPWGVWPQPTLASARYCRFMRVRFFAGAMAALSGQSTEQLYLATLIPPGFFVAGGNLDPVLHSAKMWKNRFRKHLNDAGLSRNGGFMVAGLDASYEENARRDHTGYQFHYHAIVDEQMVATIEGLRTRRAYKRTSWVPRPHYLKPISTVGRSLTYLVKSFWTSRSSTSADAPASVVRNGSRLAPEQLVEALTWFHGQRFADMVMKYNFRLPGYVICDGW